MKKVLLIVGAGACFALGGVLGVVASGPTPKIASAPTPEIDRANSYLNLHGQVNAVQCAGEDAKPKPYETFTGSYAGNEIQVNPDPTDYVLSGPVSISGVAWTINLNTNRGVFLGTITRTTSSGAVVYKGAITLITQGVPSTGTVVPARGWINARFAPADDGVAHTATNPNDDFLLAKTEFKLTTTAATGQFGVHAGGGPLKYKDFSVVNNVAPVALDGHC